MPIQRTDDFDKRSAHLKNLKEEELDRLFWELADKIVDPLVKLAETHTSPSVERSVLLRMGLNSFQAATIVSKACELGLLGKGAGNLLLSYANEQGISLEEATVQLCEGKGWESLQEIFKRGKENAAGE